MHMKFERLLSKSLTTLEVMTYYLVVHMGPGHMTLSQIYLGVTDKLNILKEYTAFCLSLNSIFSGTFTKSTQSWFDIQVA